MTLGRKTEIEGDARQRVVGLEGFKRPENPAFIDEL